MTLNDKKGFFDKRIWDSKITSEHETKSVTINVR